MKKAVKTSKAIRANKRKAKLKCQAPPPESTGHRAEDESETASFRFVARYTRDWQCSARPASRATAERIGPKRRAASR